MAKVGENIYVQRSQSLHSILQEAGDAGPTGPHKLVHVLNVYRGSEASQAEQKLTLASMQQAHACSGERAADICILGAVFAEDVEFAKTMLNDIAVLERSSLDLARFAVPRKLPLLFDIIRCARQARPDATHIIYTNADIILAPHFYQGVLTLLARGFDGLIINRRTIEKFPPDAALLPLMVAAHGADHPGYDCFVFSAKAADSFVHVPSVIGMGGVMVALLHNMAACCNRMLLLRRAQFTMHLGDDREWVDLTYEDYRRFNLDAARAVYPQLRPVQQARLTTFMSEYPQAKHLRPDGF